LLAGFPRTVPSFLSISSSAELYAFANFMLRVFVVFGNPGPCLASLCPPIEVNEAPLGVLE
jgi:hypothetical protein